MKIVVGADHAGIDVKSDLVEHLTARGHDVDDLGPFDATSVDYPDFASAVARRVAGGDADFGLLVCGTGIGMAITANKVAGVRAANCNEISMARMSRAHNDANVLTVGSRIVASAYAAQILDAFLETPFEGGRHQRRVDKISALDQT